MATGRVSATANVPTLLARTSKGAAAALLQARTAHAAVCKQVVHLPQRGKLAGSSVNRWLRCLRLAARASHAAHWHSTAAASAWQSVEAS